MANLKIGLIAAVIIAVACLVSCTDKDKDERKADASAPATTGGQSPAQQKARKLQGLDRVRFSSDENSKTLSGTADTDIYSTTEMPGQEGKTFRRPHAYYHDVSVDARNKDRPVGARRFLPTTAKPGNGIGITSRSEFLDYLCSLTSRSWFRMMKLT